MFATLQTTIGSVNEITIWITASIFAFMEHNHICLTFTCNPITIIMFKHDRVVLSEMGLVIQWETIMIEIDV